MSLFSSSQCYGTQPTEEVYNQIISSVCEKLRISEEEMNQIDESLTSNLQDIYKGLGISFCSGGKKCN
jgi:hypothetical protein